MPRTTSKPANPPEPLQARLLDIKKAAAYLSSTVWAMRQLIWNRQIPHLKIANRYLFDRVDLDAFISAQKVGVARR